MNRLDLGRLSPGAQTENITSLSRKSAEIRGTYIFSKAGIISPLITAHDANTLWRSILMLRRDELHKIHNTRKHRRLIKRIHFKLLENTSLSIRNELSNFDGSKDFSKIWWDVFVSFGNSYSISQAYVVYDHIATQPLPRHSILLQIITLALSGRERGFVNNKFSYHALSSLPIIGRPKPRHESFAGFMAAVSRWGGKNPHISRAKNSRSRMILRILAVKRLFSLYLLSRNLPFLVADCWRRGKFERKNSPCQTQTAGYKDAELSQKNYDKTIICWINRLSWGFSARSSDKFLFQTVDKST